MPTITKRTTITMTTDDLPFEVEMDFSPAEWIDPVVTKREDGTYTLAYAVLENDGGSFHPINDNQGTEFEEFTTEWDRDEYFEATDLSTHVPFIVDHFEHSAHDYSLRDSVAYGYMGFDTRPSCVLRVPVDFTDPREAAKAILSEYTSWVNGDVYGIVRQDFDAEGNETSNEAVWGFIGTEYAESVVKDIDSHI